MPIPTVPTVFHVLEAGEPLDLSQKGAINPFATHRVHCACGEQLLLDSPGCADAELVVCPRCAAINSILWIGAVLSSDLAEVEQTLFNLFAQSK